MSDDQAPPGTPKRQEPLPERFSVPHEEIQKWVEFPSDAFVEVRLTKAELDQLFFGLTTLVGTQQAIQDALVKWSNGDVEGANKALDGSRRGNIIADNHVRRFFAAIWTKATQR